MSHFNIGAIVTLSHRSLSVTCISRAHIFFVCLSSHLLVSPSVHHTSMSWPSWAFWTLVLWKTHVNFKNQLLLGYPKAQRNDLGKHITSLHHICSDHCFVFLCFSTWCVPCETVSSQWCVSDICSPLRNSLIRLTRRSTHRSRRYKDSFQLKSVLGGGITVGCIVIEQS